MTAPPTPDRPGFLRALRRKVKHALARANREWVMRYGRASYSQEGEDALLSRIFDGQQQGFYVDIGAYHPVEYSNTYLFYRRGWRGITVEPTPGAKRLFDRKRPRDVNLACAVGAGPGPVPLCLHTDGVFNRLAHAGSAERLKMPYSGTVMVPVVALAELLERRAAETPIDFLSLDVEGAELEVLQSNDWQRFRPRVICAEILRADIGEVPAHPVGRFLVEQGYRYFARTGFSCFFAERDMPIYSELPH